MNDPSQSQFDYPTNLVISREDRARSDEPTGEPISLSGMITQNEMGMYATKSKPRQDDKNKKKDDKNGDKQMPKPKSRMANQTQFVNPKKKSKIHDLQNAYSAINVPIKDYLLYVPQTAENRQLYNLILDKVLLLVGDLTDQELKGTVDEILAELKRENVKDDEKKTNIETLTQCKLTDETFREIYSWSKKITDYTAERFEGDKLNRVEKMTEIPIVIPDEDEYMENSDDESYKGSVKESNSEEDESSGSSELDEAQQIEIKMKEGFQDMVDEGGEGDGMMGGIGQYQKDVIDVGVISAYWLQTELNKHFNDPQIAKQIELEVMQILNSGSNIECENKLVALLKDQKFDLIKLLLKNRFKIYYSTKLEQAQTQQEKEEIQEEMRQTQVGLTILEDREKIKLKQEKDIQNLSKIKMEASKMQKQLQQKISSAAADIHLDNYDLNIDNIMDTEHIKDEDFNKISKKIIDLDTISFMQGGHFMSNEQCQLPKGSYKHEKKGYEEVFIPAMIHKADNKPLVKRKDLPDWIQPAFPEYVKELNRIQSEVYETAFKTPENMLVCAPTGAGKTNVALLAMLQTIGNYRKRDGTIDKDKFKIVYIAPMKALVAEQVGNFKNRLEAQFGLQIRELTGDMQLTKQQISETQIIVATPEKWDIITRKSGEKTYTEQVKLIIIDEIHLLHDLRGPVLEAIVARTIRMIESTQEMIRLVGLSATLPNYADVATFLRVKADKGLFYFDHTFRPVPLEQQFIGITEKKAVKKMLLMNEILYEKVIERAGKYQLIIFVHSRRETVKTAKALKEMAQSRDELSKFLKQDSNSYQILQEETAKNNDLNELLKFGFAIHHAGLHRLDRTLVEELFNDRHIQVLVSTATLAWGVNLPAHTVIIKGTQIYSPEQGKWAELSPQDILQMIGRAGRPGLDTKGEGIIITGYQELKYYLSLLNQQLPIESQLISQLSDQLNAEIVLGSINNLKDAVNWLGYTYLYIRMLRAPGIYSITEEEYSNDRLLFKRRTDLIHSAASLLDKNSLIKYDKKTGYFQPTSLGKIASHYYIKHPSIVVYNSHIKPTMGVIELFKVFSMSSEFKFIPIRDEEKVELSKLIETVPLPIKASASDPTTKVNVLLQAYISRLKMDGYALNADMVYVTQSAGRIMRGLFEIFLKRGWANIAEIALGCCKMIEHRMWSCMTPLRQFQGIPDEILRRLEKKEQITFEHLYNMNPEQIGNLVKFPKIGKVLHKFVHQFPRIELSAFVQPITRSCLRIDLTITPDFHWDDRIHGSSEPFWILVEDTDCESILYSEMFVLKKKYQEDKEYIFEFTVPLFEPLHPIYYLKVVSDRWLQSEAQLPISFKNLILPDKFSAPTELLDRQLLPVQALKWTEAEFVFKDLGIKEFNSIQTQVFQSFFNSDETIYLGSAAGSGKSICAIFAILRVFKEHSKEKIVYISPFESLCKQKFKLWQKVLGQIFNKKIGMLKGHSVSDLKVLEKNDIIISQPEYWDMISRRWKQRKVLTQIKLFIVDQIHLMNQNGSVMEVITSRMRYIASQQEQKRIRIIALGTSVANYKDIAEWIGASPSFTFNFHPNVRPVPLDIQIIGFEQNHKHSRILSMQKGVYSIIKQHCKQKQVMIVVSDRKQARLTALDLVTMVHSDNNPKRFLLISDQEMKPFIERISEKNLQHVLQYGIGFLYEGMNEDEREIIEQIYDAGAIQVLISTYSLAWDQNLNAFCVIIMDTQRFDGQEKRYIDYTIPDILQIMGRANQAKVQNENTKFFCLCHTPKKEYYKKFLFEPYPVESHLNNDLHDHINAEIVAKTIESKQDCIDWFTWTFMYRRLTQNPNYYNLKEVSGAHINDYLSELIETVVSDLEKTKAIAVEEELELLPLNLGIIASFYNIKTSTIEHFSTSIGPSSKLNKIIEILSGATEFENIPIRHKEDFQLKQLSTEINYKIEKAKFNEPATKTNILLQCHFSRTILSSDFYFDQKFILEQAIHLILALVDVISSNCWLKPALLAMQVCQMVVQSMWMNDSAVYQLPHITSQIVKQLKEKNVEDIADFMEMDDNDRLETLNMSKKQIDEIADFCNRYTQISVEFQVVQNEQEEEVRSGDKIQVIVNVTRDNEDYSEFVHSPYYPKEKEEFYWVLIGDSKANKLHAVKRIIFKDKAKVELIFDAPAAGQYNFSLYLVNDSYIGCDHQEQFKMTILEGEEIEEEEDENEEEEEMQQEN